MRNLALHISRADAAYMRAARELEDFLDAVYDRWESFEWDAALAIDIYGVEPSDAAVDALLRAGFAGVTQHRHTQGEFTGCDRRGACEARGAEH